MSAETLEFNKASGRDALEAFTDSHPFMIDRTQPSSDLTPQALAELIRERAGLSLHELSGVGVAPDQEEYVQHIQEAVATAQDADFFNYLEPVDVGIITKGDVNDSVRHINKLGRDVTILRDKANEIVADGAFNDWVFLKYGRSKLSDLAFEPVNHRLVRLLEMQQEYQIENRPADKMHEVPARKPQRTFRDDIGTLAATASAAREVAKDKLSDAAAIAKEMKAAAAEAVTSKTVNITDALSEEWSNLSPDARQKLTAAVTAGMMAVTLTATNKNLTNPGKLGNALSAELKAKEASTDQAAIKIHHKERQHALHHPHKFIAHAENVAIHNVDRISREAGHREPNIIMRKPQAKAVVGRIDAVALSAFNGLRRHQHITESRVESLKKHVQKAMLAARHPELATAARANTKPTNDFQAHLATQIKNSLLSNNVYETDQKNVISTLLAQAIDEATPVSKQNQVLDHYSARITKLAEQNVVPATYDPQATEAKAVAEAASNHETYGSPVDIFIRAIAKQESNGDPTQAGSAGGARGKYQYIDSTWQSNGKAFYPAATEFLTANQAPEAVQDAVMYLEYRQKYESLGHDLFKLAVSHFYPAANFNPALLDVVPPANVITPRQYAEGVLKKIDEGAWKDIKLHYLDAPNFRQVAVSDGYKEFADTTAPTPAPATAAGQQQAEVRAQAASTELDPVKIAGANIAKTAALQDIAEKADAEFEKHGNQNLETQGQNTGPVVKEYTGGPEGVNAPWCAWFVSYVYREAGHEFTGAPADANGNIPAVANLALWFQEHGTYFDTNSKDYTPQPGDVIIYGGNEHTGIVTAVDGEMITTIEGNTSGDKAYTANGNTVGKKEFNYKERAATQTITFGRPKS